MGGSDAVDSERSGESAASTSDAETTLAGDDTTAAGQETASEPFEPVLCAQKLLDAVRTDDPVDPYLTTLARYDESDLTALREQRNAALAFWLNLYNAGTQMLLDRRSELYESPLRTVRFFRATCVTVSGTDLSLDDIEHGILRGSRSKYGLGYVPRLVSGSFVRRYSLDPVDSRIHFACNCGAASCPAIRYYEPDTVDEQLERATRGYLDSTVEYDADAGVVRVPRVFLWYRGDFGGGDGILRFLQKYDVVPEDANPRLKHRSWDWTKAAGKFA